MPSNWGEFFYRTEIGGNDPPVEGFARSNGLSYAVLGSNLLTATGGAGGTETRAGGNGSTGRIAVHHYGTVTGTTNPTFTDVTDASLIETGGSFLFNFI